MPKSINKIAKNRKPSQTEIRVGDIRPLSLETPYGLFEEIDGAWYLITCDHEYKFAIVLAHHELPSFTSLKLKPAPITSGYFWGKFDVSAGPSIDDFRSTDTGLMSGHSWPTLSLQCHSHLSCTQWIDQGRLAAAETGHSLRSISRPDWPVI